MSPNALQLIALSRLFSPGVFRDIARKGQSAIFSRLCRQAGLAAVSGDTVADAFDNAFAILRRTGFRDEYVYRAALTRNILLGTHSLNTACMLTEFRAGACKADLTILNGTSTVYEIKSERDTLARLENQIANYKKVFAKIYIIASESHIPNVIDSTSNSVGVLCLNKRNRITKVREATDNVSNVCPVTIFESLRTDEARIILNELGVVIPKLPNTIVRKVMRDQFSQLLPEDVHSLMVKTLKRTRSLAPLNEFVGQLPSSLRAAALSVNIRYTDHSRMIQALSTPLCIAMDWK
ncbi:sce7726 family protein [Pseudomonas protegens]|uniref:sce7726 family protein n=1 Tax=Pseudomonas protegens TaxID=380021 RepID=UPI002DBA707A|nr:sce7726 family protein [Pseudomonas protegens]WRV93894.1 sce7726 family protein [Pseudomonas protegens]